VVGALCNKYGLAQPTHRKFMKARGCPACGQTGFRGRVGLFEVLKVDADVRSLIGAKADPDRILASGRKNGLTTMIEDGLTKAGLGQTTIDEILRTVG
jgi:general secretion pathway protein E